MCTDTETDAATGATISIWGSCVSRDTLEFMPEVKLGAYIARQSAIVALAPATSLELPLDKLDSSFQRRMMSGDSWADSAERIDESEADLVLIDLTDERRGVWHFPDGTFLTNSVEAFRTGIDEWAPAAGATLIEFGTDEHFSLWRRGFTTITRRIAQSGRPLILLDVAWASVFEGQVPPQGATAHIRRIGRHSRQRLTGFVRTVKRERSIVAGAAHLAARPASQGDEHVRIARDANIKYRRYIDEAYRHVSAVIVRGPEDVRMNRSHKWGVGPYHYSDQVYLSIREELSELLPNK